MYRRLVVGISLFLALHAYAADESCQTDLTSAPLAGDMKKAAERFQAFFAAIETQLFERQFFLDVAKLALLSKEHVLMLGPPGNAKSMGVDLIIDNIVEKESGETSVFKIQMTPETSLSETHGVIDYKKITEENIQTRKWEQGLLSAKLVFIDEFFDARANAIRNNLMALNEREHAQGRERIKGLTETGFAASNKYIHEVYEKAGDDGPKAIIDRFAFVSFVPGELSEVRSALKLIQEAPAKRPGQITFQDIDLLRTKVNEVTIPDYVGRMLTLIFTRLKAQTEALEESEKKRFIEQKKAGLTPLPPYRSTKYFSPRTLRKAGKILRAIVVNDWIEKGGERALSANSQDLEKLADFFTLNSLNDEFLTHLEETAVNPYEKIQVMTVLRERGMFREIYQEMMSEVNARTSVLTEIEVEREAAATPELKQQLLQKMVAAMMEAIASSEQAQTIQDLNEANLANGYIRESLEASLREMLGAEYEEVVAAKVKLMEEQRRQKIAEERRIERERLAREREEQRQRELRERKEAEEREANLRRMQEMKSAFADSSRIKTLSEGLQSGKGYAVYSVSPTGEGRQWQILSVQNHKLHYETLDLETAEASDQKDFPLSDQNEQILKITALGKGRFMLWYGMYGRIFDYATGLSARKIIHETHSSQTISDNSKNNEVWLIDHHLHKIGVLPSGELSEIDWFNMQEMQFITHSTVPAAQLAHLTQDFARAQSRIFLSDEKGVAYVFAPLSSVGGPTKYKIDLAARTITIIDVGLGTNLKRVYPGSPAVAGSSVELPRMDTFMSNATATPEGKFEGEVVRRDPSDGRDGKVSKGLVSKSSITRLSQAIWAASPDGAYIVSANGAQLFGADLVSGEDFNIAVTYSQEAIQQVQFLDQHHLLLRYPAGYQVVRLPTADR